MFRPRLNYTPSYIWHRKTETVCILKHQSGFEDQPWHRDSSLRWLCCVAQLLKDPNFSFFHFFLIFFHLFIFFANAEGEIRADLHYVSLKRCVRPCVETAYDCKRPPGGGKAFTICNLSLSRICSSGSSADSEPELPFIVGEQSGDAHLATYVQLPVVGLRLCP